MIDSKWLAIAICHTLTTIDWLIIIIGPHVAFKCSLNLYCPMFIFISGGSGKHLPLNLDVINIDIP